MDGVDIGRFGVSICYDLMDLERATLYAGRIQHLFVIAYNQDTQSFFHVSEALSRVMFCNVVICNTGHYGGSVAVSPYYRPWQRIIYKHEGSKLATSQVITLPIQDLVDAQRGDRKKVSDADEHFLFKNPPPHLQRRFKLFENQYKI
jgi:predicted amidohydrolase